MHYFVAVTKRQVNKPVYAKHKLRKNISFVKNSLTATSTKKKRQKKTFRDAEFCIQSTQNP